MSKSQPTDREQEDQAAIMFWTILAMTAFAMLLYAIQCPWDIALTSMLVPAVVMAIQWKALSHKRRYRRVTEGEG